MHYLKLAAATLLPLLMAGCASEEEPQGVIPQAYENAVDKADGVEDKLQDAARQRMQGVDEGSE